MRSWFAAMAVALAVALVAGGVYVAVRSDDLSEQRPDSPAPSSTPVPPTKTPNIRPPEPPRSTDPPVELPTPPPPTPVPATKTPNIRPPEPPRSTDPPHSRAATP